MGFRKIRTDEQVKEIIETAKEVFPKAEVKEIVKPIEPEEIPKTKIIAKASAKKIVKDKDYRDLGITGTTIEAKDFRAIIKKKGLKITHVLAELLNEWNTKNYNL